MSENNDNIQPEVHEPNMAASVVTEENADVETSEAQSQPLPKESFLDRFTAIEMAMLKGIFKFAFYDLPIFIWNYIILNFLKWLFKPKNWPKIKKIFISTALGIAIIIIIFLGWWLFMKEKAIMIIQNCWNSICAFFAGILQSVRCHVHTHQPL